MASYGVVHSTSPIVGIHTLYSGCLPDIEHLDVSAVLSLSLASALTGLCHVAPSLQDILLEDRIHCKLTQLVTLCT